MLQFFRNIRRRLLESGKVKSYVLYAIGEILLVVIGILLALQVNNWNEARKARAIEHEYLLSLREEFKANLKELDNLISLNRQLMEGAKEFLKYTGLNANSLSIEKMGELQGNTIRLSVRYEPSPGILQDLISSGNLTKITDKSLRQQLSLWEAKLAQVRRQEITIEDYRTGIKNLIIQKGNMRKVTVAETGVEPGSFNNNSQALLQDIQLENLLTYFYLSSRGLDIYSYKEIREVNVQILESIQKEIK